jgi:hypothetical protein
MSWPSITEITEPDLKPLHRALEKCGIGADKIPRVAQCLVRPTNSLGFSTSDVQAVDEIQIGTGLEADFLTLKKRDNNRDMDARMLRLNEGRPDPNANWKALSRAERKRAVRLSDWTIKPHGLSVTPQGRPSVIDPAVVLYCSRILCEATGRVGFRFSRTSETPSGPMWRALIEALPLAQSFLANRFGHPAMARNTTKKLDRGKIHVEAIAEIVRVARSEPFMDLCRLIGLGPMSEDVARSPAMFRITIAYARKSRSRTKAAD